MDWRTSTLSGAGRTHDKWSFYAGELDATCRFYIFYLPPLAANHIVPYPWLLSTLTNLLIPQCWPGHSGKMYTHTAPWPLEIGHVSIKHIWINHPRGASPLELSSMWPLPIHFTAALCGNQAWIIKVSSEQWSIHWGPCSQTARSYFSGNDIEITWVCFQTMHINVKYVRPNMSIIITVQAEAMSRLILQKCCEMMWGEQVSTATPREGFLQAKSGRRLKADMRSVLCITGMCRLNPLVLMLAINTPSVFAEQMKETLLKTCRGYWPEKVPTQSETELLVDTEIRTGINKKSWKRRKDCRTVCNSRNREVWGRQGEEKKKSNQTSWGADEEPR